MFFPLKFAALRERKEDIPLLTTHFIELLVKELGCPKPRLTRAGTETLQGYDCPVNIREVRNVIERAVIFARGRALEFDVPGVLLQKIYRLFGQGIWSNPWQFLRINREYC